MSRIRLLSDQTINQIAAGEVIEDPASVVKELIENSRDAGASAITIEIVGGGFQLIRIIDDGAGMERDDALLAFERHATSKLGSVEDLNTLMTMGFRGEALASIGAIAKVELVTMCDGGTRIVFEGGKLLKVDAAGRNRGTTITVRSLFYNVPARQKFQKSASASQSAILKMVMREALSNPSVAYRLIAGEKELLNVSSTDLQQRIEEVLGGSFTGGAIPAAFENDQISIRGVVGTPLSTRSTRSGQHLIINGRCVTCPLIANAIQEAFSTRIETRAFPIFALHIDLPPEWIDVNVHPQKREVRLREEAKILDALHAAVSQTERPPPFTELKPVITTPNWGSFRESSLVEREPPAYYEQPALKTETRHIEIMGITSPYLILPAGAIELPSADEGSLILVDLDRARSRLIFDGVISRLEGSAGAMQNLMFPITIDLAPDRALRLAANLEGTAALGIDIRPFGETSFVIESLSPTISEERAPELIDTYLEHLEKGKSGLEKELLGKLAARFATTNRKTYSIDEGRRLIEELLTSNSPFISPFGHPIAIGINPAKLFST